MRTTIGRQPVTALLAGLLAAAATVSAAPAAHADDDRRLPLPAFGAILVDQAHKKVFVSGGPTANGIVVTDFRGRIVEQIDGQHGATGMALSADGASLYVALAAGDAISVIDTRTYAETARHATGPQTCPTHVARTAALVWFGYGCANDWLGRIGRLDTAATPPAVALDQQGEAIFHRAPLLTSATAAGPVVAGQLSLSLSRVQVYDVTGDTLDAGASGDVVGSSLTDLDLTSAGATLFSASGSRDHVEAFASDDLSGRGSYHTGPHPNSVELSTDDTYLAAAVTTSGEDDVAVYQIGGTTPVREIDVPRTQRVADRGLAWAADLDKLFVITHDANNSAPILQVVDRPVRHRQPAFPD